MSKVWFIECAKIDVGLRVEEGLVGVRGDHQDVGKDLKWDVSLSSELSSINRGNKSFITQTDSKTSNARDTIYREDYCLLTNALF